jgi:ferredoxin
MLTISLLPAALFVTLVLIAFPLLLIAGIRAYSWVAGKISVQVVRCATPEAPLGLLVSWDNESHPLKVARVRLEYTELFRAGTSLALSFTFEDKAAKRKPFVIPLKLTPDQLKTLSESPSDFAAKRSSLVVEVESLGGLSIRRKLSKTAVTQALRSYVFKSDKAGIEQLAPAEPDKWSVLSRVFPWKKVVDEAPKEKAKHAPKGKTSAPQVFDFIITKVWIEPGCIVCDACENEAPDVFQVLADTCIVRPAAPLDNTGSIVAAADGCPVDVIKYDKAAKSA